MSPVQLGLDTNSSAQGGNLPPCSPFSAPDPVTHLTCLQTGQPAVNNGQFDQSVGQFNTVTVQDDRGTLSGWTVTGQLESNFNRQGGNLGPAVDNVIPADFLTWEPDVALTTPGCLPGNNPNTPACPDQTPHLGAYRPAPARGVRRAGNVTGGAPVNGTGVVGVTNDSVPAEVFAGVPNAEQSPGLGGRAVRDKRLPRRRCRRWWWLIRLQRRAVSCGTAVRGTW